MWIAENWKDYEVLDCSRGEKLERWGDYLLIPAGPPGHLGYAADAPGLEKVQRPLPTAAKRAAGSGEFFDLPPQWTIRYRDLTFNLKPFSFKHTGLFPEQAANWDWFSEKIRSAGRPVKVLNLFALHGRRHPGRRCCRRLRDPRGTPPGGW